MACRYCTAEQESTCKYNHQTNADRIRSMNDREIADFLAKYAVSGINLKVIGVDCMPTATEQKALHQMAFSMWMRWLQQPAEEIDHG